MAPVLPGPDRRRLTGVKLVTSDAHAGLVQRSARPSRAPPGSAAGPTTGEPDVRDSEVGWAVGKALLHSIYDQPDADAVHAQFDRSSTR